MGMGWGRVGIAGCFCYLFCPCDECCDSWFVILFLYGRLCLLFSVAILIVLQLHLIIKCMTCFLMLISVFILACGFALYHYCDFRHVICFNAFCSM